VCAADFQFVVTFRDPFERLISHIRFEAQFMKPHTGMPYFRNCTFDSIDSPEAKRGTPVDNNYYIRTLLDYDTFKAPVGSIGKKHLAKAKWVLDHFVVLVLEQSEDLPDLMECYLGWQRPEKAEVKHVNRTPGKLSDFMRTQMDTAWVEELKRLNALDYELYEYAKGLSRQQADHCRQYLLGRNRP
jgi:hypothetical protein